MKTYNYTDPKTRIKWTANPELSKAVDNDGNEASPELLAIIKKHFAARARANYIKKAREQVMRDYGLTKCVVNGKTFWE